MALPSSNPTQAMNKRRRISMKLTYNTLFWGLWQGWKNAVFKTAQMSKESDGTLALTPALSPRRGERPARLVKLRVIVACAWFGLRFILMAAIKRGDGTI